MENKKSFILYNDLISVIEKLPDEKAGQLFKIILNYVNNKTPVVDDLLLQIAFEPIKNQLERDSGKWQLYVEKQRRNGERGGRPSKTQAFLTEPKKADTVNDSVTVNDTVNVTDNVSRNTNLPSGEEVPHPIQLFVKTLVEVQRIKTQLSYKDCEALLIDYGEELVKDILLAMENTKGVAQKYTSVYLTASNWAKRRKASVRINDPGAVVFKKPHKPITPDQL